MNFLFRRPINGHTFMTTQDPSYVYSVLCGHCDYPIEPDDEKCPRCQQELEDCPVCRETTHKRARKVAPEPVTGLKRCPVCDTRRIPFGGQPIGEIEGSFCRNLYGCWAGGLLLRNEELAVLRPDASMCPNCRHPELTPLDVRIFLYLVSRCLFCNSVFGPMDKWMPGWSRDWEPTTETLKATGLDDASTSCILCGRRDRLKKGDPGTILVADGADSEGPRTREMKALHYLRVVELGRVLILEKDPAHAFHRLFATWFEPHRIGSPEVSVPVQEVSRTLLEGTVEVPIHRVLRSRVDEFQRAWGMRLPSDGLSYPLTGRDGRKPRRA